jgi:hypothetical protein
MSTLRKDLIRLAHSNPGKVRNTILPVLTKRSGQLDVASVSRAFVALHAMGKSDLLEPLLTKESAGKFNFHEAWRDLHQKIYAQQQKGYNAILKKLAGLLKKEGFALDMKDSWLSSYAHGSDGVRMEGELHFEDTKEFYRDQYEIEDLLQPMGVWSGPSRQGAARWKVDVTET